MLNLESLQFNEEETDVGYEDKDNVDINEIQGRKKSIVWQLNV
jgi:hypothetical protein